ncbi:MAG: DUF4350 domain-containing protein [Gammaproteobacteria bacterium]
MRDKLLVLILAAVFIGGCVTWFLMLYERVDVNERGQMSAVVRANPVYGLSKFLERYDIKVQRLPTLNTRLQMPEYSDTLIVEFDAIYMTETETVVIADWVAAGGHLVLPLPYATEGSLLEYFNIHTDLDEDEEDEEDSGETVFGGEPVPESDGNEESMEIPDRFLYDATINSAPLGEFSLHYKVYDDLYSNRETLWTIGLERKNHQVPDDEDEPVDKRTYALGFQYGLGTVSLLSDYAHWNNDNFHEHDNALMSLAMLSYVRPPGTVWYVQTISRSGLLELIWRNAAHLILWLGLAIILFFWWSGQRIGRILPNPGLERREFNEHLVASGRFLWSHKKRDKLLNGAQEALRGHARQRHPRLHALKGNQADMHMKKLLEQDYALWTFAMSKPETYSKPQFLEQIKAIQKLWTIL